MKYGKYYYNIILVLSHIFLYINGHSKYRQCVLYRVYLYIIEYIQNTINKYLLEMIGIF